MRVLLVNERGVRFHTGIVKDPEAESYCSCSSQKTLSVRNLEIQGDDLYITLPNNEYAVIVLNKTGTTERPIRQHNPQGVSVYSTSNFMASVRFFETQQDAIRYLHGLTVGHKQDFYLVSVKKIEKIAPKSDTPSEIFIYDDSFGDVFSNSYENYTGEFKSGGQQLYTNLKRSSYSVLEDSYPSCWSSS